MQFSSLNEAYNIPNKLLLPKPSIEPAVNIPQKITCDEMLFHYNNCILCQQKQVENFANVSNNDSNSTNTNNNIIIILLILLLLLLTFSKK